MIKEEIKIQKEKMKDQPFIEKLKWFIYYYKIHIGLTVFLIIAVISTASTVIEGMKERTISVSLVNARYFDSSESSLLTDYCISRNIDTKEHPASLDLSMLTEQGATDNVSLATSQKLTAYIQTGDIDILIGNKWLIDDYARLGSFDDIQKTLPPDLYTLVKDSLVYYTYEDLGKVAIAIDLSKNEKFLATKAYEPTDTPTMAIPFSAQKKDAAIDFIKYLYE